MRLLLLTAIMAASLCLRAAEGPEAGAEFRVPEQGDDLSRLHWRVDEAGFDASKFVGLFRQEAIGEGTLRRMSGRSMPQGCPIRAEELRYLIVPHYDGHGSVRIGEMVCNREIADELLEIFRELFEQRYAIERMRLIDDYDGDDERSMEDNNSSCFNYRRVSGSRTLSLHGRGLAVDLNPLYNPMVDNRKGRRRVAPGSGAEYANRSCDFLYKITGDDAACRAFRRRGFSWGGSWRAKKDYQHFQKRPANSSPTRQKSTRQKRNQTKKQ